MGGLRSTYQVGVDLSASAAAGFSGGLRAVVSESDSCTWRAAGGMRRAGRMEEEATNLLAGGGGGGDEGKKRSLSGSWRRRRGGREEGTATATAPARRRGLAPWTSAAGEIVLLDLRRGRRCGASRNAPVQCNGSGPSMRRRAGPRCCCCCYGGAERAMLCASCEGEATRSAQGLPGREKPRASVAAAAAAACAACPLLLAARLPPPGRLYNAALRWSHPSGAFIINNQYYLLLSLSLHYTTLLTLTILYQGSSFRTHIWHTGNNMGDVPFLGCKISLISKSDIRYEGILYCVDPKESTIALSKVKSYGTETRGDPGNYVAPKNDVYDIIIFRASDVKDLRVDAPEPPGLSDPAIISARQSNTAFDVINKGSLPTSSGPSQTQQQQQHQQQQLQQHHHHHQQQQHQQHRRSDNDRRENDRREHDRRDNDRRDMDRRENDRRDHDRRDNDRRDHPRRDDTRGRDDGRREDGRRDDGRRDVNRRDQAARPKTRNQVNTRYNNARNYDERRGPNHRDDNSKGPTYRRGPMRGGRRGKSGDRTGAPRGPRASAPLKFEGEYDFDEANKLFLQLDSKFKNLKLKGEEKDSGEGSGDRAGSKLPAGPSESVSDYDSEDHNKNGDSKDGSQHEEYYDRSKSFFDNISCEATGRSQGKGNKPDWRKERQINAETFGISANYRRGGYRGRSTGANGYHRR